MQRRNLIRIRNWLPLYFCVISTTPAVIMSLRSGLILGWKRSSQYSTLLTRRMSTGFDTPGVDSRKMLNFYSISDEDFQEIMKQWGQPSFRVKQVRSWVYEKGVNDFSSMLDLPVGLRTKLAETFSVGDLRLASEQVSKDGTRKRAYQLSDGQLIESVLMPYDDGRQTACVSSQAGCAMGCVFCATGQMGFSRQLSSAEIFEQVQRFSSELRKDGHRLSNVVMMGMGEPLANYENVMTAIRRMNTELGIGARHITISTVGLVPRIRKLAEEDMQVGLAVSLHQANDAKRSALMPVNKRYPIGELIEACHYYVSKTNRRVTFEWALIRGETDTPETAKELGILLRGLHCHVNVIPLNPTNGYGGKPTPKAGVDEFCRILGEYGIPATPRTRRGIDIDAGCGQLKADLLRKQKKSSAPATGTAVGSDEAGASEACGAEGTTANNSVNDDGNDDDSKCAEELLVIPKMTADVEVEREHTFREMETEVTGNRVQRKSPGPEQQQAPRKAPLKGSTSTSRGTSGTSGTSKKSTDGTDDKPKKISLIRKPRPAGARDASASGSPPAGKSSRSRRPE